MDKEPHHFTIFEAFHIGTFFTFFLSKFRHPLDSLWFLSDNRFVRYGYLAGLEHTSLSYIVPAGRELPSIPSASSCEATRQLQVAPNLVDMR